MTVAMERSLLQPTRRVEARPYQREAQDAVYRHWDENPGMGKAGYYYYLVVFAKGLAAYGERTVTDSEGVKHDWAMECAAKILSMQNQAAGS